MKLSETIREAQSRLIYNEECIFGETDNFSCNCVQFTDCTHTNTYFKMLREYDFVPHYSTLLNRIYLDWPKHERQEFRIHMMELMACIAEDEGN